MVLRCLFVLTINATNTSALFLRRVSLSVLNVFVKGTNMMLLALALVTSNPFFKRNNVLTIKRLQQLQSFFVSKNSASSSKSVLAKCFAKV